MSDFNIDQLDNGMVRLICKKYYTKSCLKTNPDIKDCRYSDLIYNSKFNSVCNRGIVSMEWIDYILR